MNRLDKGILGILGKINNPVRFPSCGDHWFGGKIRSREVHIAKVPGVSLFTEAVKRGLVDIVDWVWWMWWSLDSVATQSYES